MAFWHPCSHPDWNHTWQLILSSTGNTPEPPPDEWHAKSQHIRHAPFLLFNPAPL
jgi:hypothetical protein